MKIIQITFIALAISGSLIAQQRFEPTWESIDSREIPSWYTSAKFGIFIHWGVYSVPAWAPANIDIGKNFGQKFSEWYWWRLEDPKNEYVRPHHEKLYGDKNYQEFAPEFKAEFFDPVQWADIFKRSGARYVVLTSKHHDGYTLWPSEQSWNWNSMDVGAKRDLCGDLSEAVKEAGLHMGFYYSLYEWFNPLYNSDLNMYVNTHMIPQMKDLIVRYEPDIFWTDGEWSHTSDKFKSTEFLAWLYNESPVKNKVVVNDRWGKETRSRHGGFYTTEYNHVHGQEGIGEKSYHPWEECRGIGGSFGWNRTENLENYSSSEELVHILIDKVANGGNLLLNIGPTGDGRIPVIMQQRLSDIGKWLIVNGEAIYETQVWKKSGSNMKKNHVYYTTKEDVFYVICTKWHEIIEVPHISKCSKVTLLGSDLKIDYKLNNGKLIITAPLVNPETVPCEYAYVYKIWNARY